MFKEAVLKIAALPVFSRLQPILAANGKTFH
jgi:hypothetical protein